MTPDIQTIDIQEIIDSYKNQSLYKILGELSQTELEITIAVHAAFDLSFSEVSENRKKQYLDTTRDFLRFCKERGIKILHLRDMVKELLETVELTLEDKFGFQADYEVPTFPNMGFPLELKDIYFEQKSIYDIFCQYCLPHLQIPIVNGIGIFTDIDGCFIDGLEVMEGIASKELRIIQECVLSKQKQAINIDSYVSESGLDLSNISLYSFRDNQLIRKDSHILN